jgi:hypothetical protein
MLRGRRSIPPLANEYRQAFDGFGFGFVEAVFA